MKIRKIIKTMDVCEQSILNLFKFHQQNEEETISFVDVLIAFGQCYAKPLEIYSLRFFMNGTDNAMLDEKMKKNLQTMIGRKLQSIDSLWNAPFKATECKILANINDNRQQSQECDCEFVVKHNLNIRIKHALYFMNFWNKHSMKRILQTKAKSVGNNKENVIPQMFVHSINQSNEESDDRIWYLAKFSFKGFI